MRACVCACVRTQEGRGQTGPGLAALCSRLSVYALRVRVYTLATLARAHTHAGGEKVDRARLAALGANALLAYGFVSNIRSPVLTILYNIVQYFIIL